MAKAKRDNTQRQNDQNQRENDQSQRVNDQSQRGNDQSQRGNADDQTEYLTALSHYLKVVLGRRQQYTVIMCDPARLEEELNTYAAQGWRWAGTVTVDAIVRVVLCRDREES